MSHPIQPCFSCLYCVSLFQGCAGHSSPAVSNVVREAGLRAVPKAVMRSTGVGVQQLGAPPSLFFLYLPQTSQGLGWCCPPVASHLLRRIERIRPGGPLFLTCVAGDQLITGFIVFILNKVLPYRISSF